MFVLLTEKLSFTCYYIEHQTNSWKPSVFYEEKLENKHYLWQNMSPPPFFKESKGVAMLGDYGIYHSMSLY